jgi:hypothetical protein
MSSKYLVLDTRKPINFMSSWIWVVQLAVFLNLVFSFH